MKLPAILAAAALVLAAIPLQAQPAGSKVLLLGSENIRNELGLSQTQRHSLDAMRVAFRNEARELVSAGDAGSASRLLRVTEFYDNRALALLTPAQSQQLAKIEHRVLGAWVVTNPAIQQKLGLSEKQIAKITAIQDRMAAKNADINRMLDEGKITPAGRLDKLRDARLDLTRSLERILSRQQRNKLRSLEG